MSRPLSASSGSGCQHGQEPDLARSGQPGEETAIRSELRGVYDVAASWFRGHAALNHPIAAYRWRRGQLLGTTGQQRTARVSTT
jgi:hypothetical protein